MISGSNENNQDASTFNLISSFLGPSAIPPVSTFAERHSREEQQKERTECARIGDREREVKRFLHFQHRTIIFSKDRPWQLQQLLRSMSLDSSLNIRELNIFIICKLTSDYELGYSKVKEEFDHLTWFYEDSGDGKSSFRLLFEKALREPLSNLQPGTDTESTVNSESLVMFLTDDCIFLEPVENVIESAKSVFRNSRTFGFLTRLHPGITHSQTKDEASPPPRSHLAYHETGNELKAFVYPQRYGSKEFSYPFDLSGGVYPRKTCIDILNEIERVHSSNDITNAKKVGYLHPNTLEINGNNAILRIQNERKGNCHIEKKDLLAIPSQPTLLVLAINRVQNIYKAPIAIASFSNGGIKTEQQGRDPFTPELLSTYLENDFHLDLSFYKLLNYNSSHIGDVVLQHCTRKKIHETQKSKVALSVLVPVHTGPPSASDLAIKSILYQTLEDPSILPIQIVLVDDRCRDGSIERMLKTARDFDREHQQVYRPFLRIRNSQDSNCYDLSKLDNIYPEPITIDVVRSPSPGVGAALNFGLEVCRADFVARMDADDISCPRRLISQLRYLQHNPEIQVVGTNGVLFTESKASSHKDSDPETNLISVPFTVKQPQLKPIRSSIEPTDSGFVAWSLIFSCVIMHPSVMLRKAAFTGNIRYSQSDSVSCTEDYDLWLRLIEQNPKSICSIPLIGILHRKHGNRSNCDQRSRLQREESTLLSHRATKELCGISTSLEVVEALKYPHDTNSITLLNQAAELLCALEEGFVTNVGTQLTKNEIELISLDCDGRLGELAVLAVEKFGREATKHMAWNLWCQRCPDLQMERLSLLLYAK